MTAGSAAAKVVSIKFDFLTNSSVLFNMSGIRKIKAQVMTKMENSIKKGKLIVRKIDKHRASMGLLGTKTD